MLPEWMEPHIVNDDKPETLDFDTITEAVEGVRDYIGEKL